MNGDEQIESLPSRRWSECRHPFLALIVAGAAGLGCAFASCRQRADTPQQDPPPTTRAVDTLPGVLRFELITDNSQVRLRGTTNLSEWNSVTEDIRATIRLRTDLSSINAVFARIEAEAKADLPPLPLTLASPSDVQITIPVKSFRGDSAGMDRDMQKALKANEHPDISYSLKEVQTISASDQLQEHRPVLVVRGLGDLNVAGVQQESVTDATIYRDAQGHFIIHAEEPLKMSDFGIEPPTALFGLIHAQNSMTVTFDLDLAPDRSTAATLPVHADQNHP